MKQIERLENEIRRLKIQYEFEIEQLNEQVYLQSERIAMLQRQNKGNFSTQQTLFVFLQSILNAYRTHN